VGRGDDINATGVVCGPCGTELPPNAKSYNESAVPSYRVKLPAGSNTSVELPFSGLLGPTGVAVDTVGNVYVADRGNNRVLKLPAG
jgi:DNA-binding beta-propeller fold protein YncE